MFGGKIKNITLALVVVMITGCASFEKKELTRLDTLPDVSQYENKPSVYVDVKFYRGMPGDRSMEMSQVTEKLIPIVERAVEKSALFSQYTFDESQNTEHDYVIRMNVYNHGNVAAASISGFITGFTFGVIPGAATDNFTLDMEAVDRNGRFLSSFSNKDSMTTWFGLWFIPMMGNTPDKAVDGTLENQVMTALKELIESGVMKYSYRNHLLFEVMDKSEA